MIDHLSSTAPFAPSWVSGLAWTFAWQSTLWLAIGLLAARIARRHASRAHLLLIIATSAAVMSPLLTAAIRQTGWGVLPPPPAVVSATPDLAAAPPSLVRESPQRDPADPPIDSAMSEPLEPTTGQLPSPVVEPPAASFEPKALESKPQPTLPKMRLAESPPIALVGIWLLASLILAIRLGASLCGGRRIARDARPETSELLLAALREATDALRLTSMPLLRVSSSIRCPMIWCWGARPTILVPAAAAAQTPIIWRSVFCHEVAHLVRRDHWSALWAEFVIILLPWQPLGWRTRTRLAYLREQACDDWVLSVGGEATDYAESLLQLVPQGSPSHGLAAVSSRESLKRRLEHLLAGVRIAPKVGRRWIAAASLFALVAIAGVGFAQQGTRVPGPNSEVAKDIQAPAPKVAQNPSPTTIPSDVAAVRGRVLLPNGQPAVSATVRAVRSTYASEESPRDEVKVIATLSTDSQGEFQFRVDVGALKELGPRINLWATLPGYGVAVRRLVPGEKNDLIVMNLTEEVAIRGRMIDLEGRPIREARVEAVRYIDTITAAVDEWLASVAGKEKPVGIALDKVIGGHPAPLDWARNRRDTAILHVNSIEVISEAILPVVKTNADGRFEFRGIGRDRFVVLRISAPRSTTVFPVSLTRALRSNPFPPGELVGPEFERVVPPSAPVEGFVTDEESGKPVSGAVMNPHLWHQAIGLAGYFAIAMPAISDATGYYRLEGLDRLNTNIFTITPGDSPHFSGREQIPIAKGLEPTRIDIKLRHGIWATGRAYNQVTGKPVEGTVAYSPSSSNKLRRGFSAIRLRGAHTDATGRFRVLVLPGRGMVRLSCKGDYRFNAGAAQVKDFRSFSQVGINRVCEIDVPPNATEARVDLPADPGQNMLLKFTDAAGKPLSGVDAHGLRFPQPRSELGYARTYSEGDSAILYAVSPEDVRRVWFRHRASGLNKMFRFKQRPGETERTIILDPPAIVTGRFVTPEGKPITGLSVSCGFEARAGGPPAILGFPDVACDAEGRFRRDLPAGDRISLSTAPDRAAIVRSLTVASGEQIDLGDITITHDPKRRGLTNARVGTIKRTKPNDAVDASTDSTPRELPKADSLTVNTTRRDEQPSAHGTGPRSTDDAQTISGMVVNEAGEPLAGSNVAVLARMKQTRRGGDLGGSLNIAAEVTADGDGKFRLSVRRIPPTSVWFYKILVRADGYGPAWRDLKTDVDASDLKLSLPREQIIRGRFVDLQGQPVTGVRARVQTVLPARKGNASDPIGIETAGPEPAPWPHDCLSDAAGRFVLQGIGAGQGVSLFLNGSDKLAPQAVTINTGQSERREANDATYRPGAVRNLKPGEEGIFAVAPAQMFEGVVRFADTKQPAANARLTIYASQQEFGGSFLGLSGQADDKGHFRINPYPGINFQITAYPLQGTPYLARLVTVAVKSGEGQRNVVVELPRGTLVHGNTVDADDNRPIPNCSIQYVPTAAATRRAPTGVMTGWQAIELSNPRGEFAIPVLSGPGHLLVHGPTSHYVYQEIGGRALDQDRAGGLRNYAHAISRIDPPKDATSPIVLTIKLKRSTTISGRLLAPDGQPVEEALMINRLQINPLSPTWRGFATEPVRGGSFAVSGCAPGVECPVYFLDQAHRTGATVRVASKSEGQDSVIVRLAPCGSAKARFVDSEGKPIEDLEPSLHLVVTPGASPFDMSDAAREQLSADEDYAANIDRKNQTPFPKTDPDGVATFGVLIPGATYELAGGRNRQLAPLKQFSAEAGKTVNLGDIVADRPRGRAQ